MNDEPYRTPPRSVRPCAWAYHQSGLRLDIRLLLSPSMRQLGHKSALLIMRITQWDTSSWPENHAQHDVVAHIANKAHPDNCRCSTTSPRLGPNPRPRLLFLGRSLYPIHLIGLYYPLSPVGIASTSGGTGLSAAPVLGHVYNLKPSYMWF
jgi:hypothetical protein